MGSVAEAGWPRLCLGWKPAAVSGSELVLGLGDSNVLVKEMLPLVNMDDMLVVKKNGDDLVPAFGTKTSAAWFSSGTYPGDRGAVKPFKTLHGQVLTPDHPPCSLWLEQMTRRHQSLAASHTWHSFAIAHEYAWC